MTAPDPLLHGTFFALLAADSFTLHEEHSTELDHRETAETTIDLKTLLCSICVNYCYLEIFNNH